MDRSGSPVPGWICVGDTLSQRFTRRERDKQNSRQAELLHDHPSGEISASLSLTPSLAFRRAGALARAEPPGSAPGSATTTKRTESSVLDILLVHKICARGGVSTLRRDALALLRPAPAVA